MDVSGQLHAPATLPPGKESLIPTGWGYEGLPLHVRIKLGLSWQ